jgi:hypothetical protein
MLWVRGKATTELAGGPPFPPRPENSTQVATKGVEIFLQDEISVGTPPSVQRGLQAPKPLLVLLLKNCRMPIPERQEKSPPGKAALARIYLGDKKTMLHVKGFLL